MGAKNMSVLFLMIPMALLLGGLFVYGFFWATSSGQMDDLETPAHRILNDNIIQKKTEEGKSPHDDR